MGYQEERKNLEKFSTHLEKMGVPFNFKDIGKEEEVFPAIICTYRHEEIDFDVIIYNIANWIHVKCLVLDVKGFPSQVSLSIFKLALKLNYDLPETTFSLYKNKLYLEIDCLIDIDYDDFLEEFNSIPMGLNTFISTLRKKEEEVKIASTKGTLEKMKEKLKR